MAIESGIPRHGDMQRPRPRIGRTLDARPPVSARNTDAVGRPAEAARVAAVAERRRLARDLHDSVSQTLIGLHLTAQVAVDLWETQPAQARAALETVRSLAAGASTELRAVLLDLHDAVLERRGLVAALEAYCDVVRERSGLHVELRVVGPDPSARITSRGPSSRPPARHEEAAYWLVREALANVVKHARATHATVTLLLGTPLRVCVEDDGVGFGATPAAFSYGLAGMRERVGALGGRLTHDNGPAGGARVAADLPVSNHEPLPTRPTLAHDMAVGYPAPRHAQEIGR